MNKHRLGRWVGAVAVVFLCAQPAQARDPFSLAIDLDNNASIELTQGFDNIERAIDQLDFKNLQARTGYNGFQPVRADFFLRGLNAALTFATLDSGNLDFRIDGVDFNNGANSITFRPRDSRLSIPEQRADSLQQLKDYLKQNASALKAILTAFARFSAIDPLAGNPASLFSRTQAGDFSNGFTHKVSQIFGCGTSAFNFSNDAPIQVAVVGGVSDIFADAQARAAALQAENELGVGLAYSNTTARATGGDFQSSTLTMPLSYTVKFDANPSHKLRFDLPLTATDTEGAKTYSLGFGIAYTYPVSDVWTLTPGVGVGATGSEDLGSAGGVSAYSLTSAYTWRLGNYALSMGNAVGQYDSLGIKLGDIKAEADISNTVFTNGFLLSGPNSLIAKNLVMEYSFLNTQITGDAVYSDGANEIGVALGYINTEQGVISSYMKAGLSYQVADGLNGDINTLRLNLAARF